MRLKTLLIESRQVKRDLPTDNKVEKLNTYQYFKTAKTEEIKNIYIQRSFFYNRPLR